MPNNVFGISFSSLDNAKKIDTSLCGEKPHLRTNYIKSYIEEEIDLKNQFRIENLPDSISNTEAASKNSVDSKFNDLSVIKNTDQADFNDKNINEVRSIKVNSIPTLEEELTPKVYVDQAISEGVDDLSLLRIDPDEKLNLEEQDSIVLNSI